MRPFFSKRFKKAYQRLPKPVQQSFNERLVLFFKNTQDPLLRNHALTGEWESCRSINVTGSYRAIYRQETKTSVRFLAIGTHSELYE